MKLAIRLVAVLFLVAFGTLAVLFWLDVWQPTPAKSVRAVVVKTPIPTHTPVPPTATATPIPPTATATPTPIPPTATATPTPIPPTATPTEIPTPLPPTPIPTPTLPPNFADRFTFQPHDKVTKLEPGVIEVNRAIGGENPLHIHLLLFDLTAPQFSIRTAVQNDWLSGVAPTSKIAASHKALAAVNGDLFGATGLPEGLTILDSRVAISPKHRATFAWSTDGKPFIGYFTPNWTWDAVVTGTIGYTHTLQLLNTPCKSGELCIYNDLYGGLPYHYGDVKILINPNNMVVGITSTSRIKIPDGYQVLWGLGPTADWLRNNMIVGQFVGIAEYTNPPLSNYTAGVSGGPIILENGNFHQDCLCNIGDCSQVPQMYKKYYGTNCEEFTLDWKLTHYLDVMMPRLGVGYDARQTTLIVAEVDGYQPGYSVGIRQDDFAALFKEFGATTAMELDGGGSATMWAKGKLVSQPSDGTYIVERWVPNALLFYWDENIPSPAPIIPYQAQP